MEQNKNNPSRGPQFGKPRRKPRSDGFSPERKRLFLVALRRGDKVLAACAAVGVSNRTAYNHRRDDPDFAREWALARASYDMPLGLVAYERAIGVEEPVHTYGRLTHKVVRRSDNLLRALLIAEDPERFGPQAGLAAERERTRRMIDRQVEARIAPVLGLVGEIVNFMNLVRDVGEHARAVPCRGKAPAAHAPAAPSELFSTPKKSADFTSSVNLSRHCRSRRVGDLTAPPPGPIAPATSKRGR